MEEGNPHWVDWESTSEFDTGCDEQVVSMTQKLQEHVMELQALQAAQLLGEVVAEVVMQVVLPVVTTTPIPVEMDMDTAGARPDSSMGPGLLAPSPVMPLVFDTDDRQKQ